MLNVPSLHHFHKYVLNCFFHCLDPLRQEVISWLGKTFRSAHYARAFTRFLQIPGRETLLSLNGFIRLDTIYTWRTIPLVSDGHAICSLK
jgi:hypothetical protein